MKLLIIISVAIILSGCTKEVVLSKSVVITKQMIEQNRQNYEIDTFF